MRGERRQQVRLDDPAEVLVDSGLIDPDYVAAQLGTTFDSVQDAARAAIDAGDVSPHPLFEAQWIGRRRSWQRVGQHPVLWYVSERRRRNRISPHPLVDPRIIFATHPEARHHPYGALSYWLSVSDPGTPLPTRILPKKVSWSTYRAAAIDAAAGWRAEVVLERPELVGPTPPRPTTLATSPAVTVVMATQDQGPLVHETVASLQAQTFTDWHLVAVDRGSVDDTAAVLQGMAAFDERITLVRESRCGHARALNVALEHSTAEHVAFLPLGREWLPEMLDDLLAHAHRSGGSAVLAGVGAVGRSRARAARRTPRRPDHRPPAPRRDQGRRRLRRDPSRRGRARPAAPAHARAGAGRGRRSRAATSGPRADRPTPTTGAPWSSSASSSTGTPPWRGRPPRTSSATSCRWAPSRGGPSSGRARCRATGPS